MRTHDENGRYGDASTDPRLLEATCSHGPNDKDDDDAEQEDKDYDDTAADEQENLPGGTDTK